MDEKMLKKWHFKSFPKRVFDFQSKSREPGYNCGHINRSEGLAGALQKVSSSLHQQTEALNT